MNVRLSFNMCMIGLLHVCIWLLMLPNITSSQPRSKPISGFLKYCWGWPKLAPFSHPTFSGNQNNIQSPLHWRSKLFWSLVILVATQQLTTKLWWNMACYGKASMYFWVTFHILWQKNQENSIIFLVWSVNSTKFLIFWQTFDTKKNEN